MTKEPSQTETTDRFAVAAERILSGELPTPVRERWQPLRAGLMNVFLFEDERFPFADGRLLLRGTNGTGKSRVLAMTLPLLLDGSFKATRVEPDRDHNRQVAWNILMDEQDSATGYSWLEFGRRAIEAPENNGSIATPEEFVTIGCGMRAKRGQSIKPWFFITQRRIDESLKLKSSEGIPLTKRQLMEELGTDGQVYDGSQRNDYRRAVDERLFRLGDRYDALIDLLLQLRQPKLAEKLDIVGLEATLREALPPLQESLLNDAADAFLELDQYRTSLESDRNALAHIQRFLKPYRDHVRRGVKRSLKQLTSANSRYETAQRKLRDLTEKKQQHKTELKRLESKQRQARIDVKAGRAAVAELERRPEIQDVQRIDELADHAKNLDARVEEFGVEVKDAESDLSRAESQQQTAEADSTRQQQLTVKESDRCRELAAPEALQNQHQELVATCLTIEHLGQFMDRKSKVLRRSKTYQKSAEHLAKRNLELATARQELTNAKAELERLEHLRQNKLDALAQSQSRLETAREKLWSAIMKWRDRANDIRAFLPEIAVWAEKFDEWVRDQNQSEPSTRILDQAKSEFNSALIVRQEKLRHDVAHHQAETEDLKAELGRLESGEPVRPSIPAHRLDLVDVAERAGVPFWALVDFHPDVPESERGNWEAALQDAGLLDSLVTPDGQLVGMDDTASSIQLTDINLQAQEESRQLARVLKLADGHRKMVDTFLNSNAANDDAQVSAYHATVSRILAVIGVGHNAGRTWVAVDGRWQNGPQHGKLTKQFGQYIGEDARARWRELRRKEITNELTSIEDAISELEEQIQSIEFQKNQVANLVDEFPSSKPLVDATSLQEFAQHEADEASEKVDNHLKIETSLSDSVDALKKQRDDEAADFGLIAWADRAEELGRRLDQYNSQLQTLEARADAFQTSLDRKDAADAQVDESHRRALSSRNRLDTAKAEFEKASQRVRVLRESIGHDVDELLKKLESERQAQERREQEAEDLVDSISESRTAVAVAETNIEQREAESKDFDQQRREATDEFADLDKHELLSLINNQHEIPAQPWAMTTAIKFARQIDNLLQNVSSDEESWLRSQTRLHKAQTELQQTVLLQDGLSVEVDPLRDGLQMVRFVLQGDRLVPTTTVARIEAEIATREQILDEREQDTLEKYLLGEVAEGLRKGIAMAAELVELMTAEVSRRPMKTGMQMRFRWRQDDDGPTGLKEACEVLSVDSATWSPDERDQIKLFLSRAIRQQKQEDETGSWHEHMRAALDYRHWHRIIIEQRKGPDANWIRLTRKTYAGGSGGEKAIALTLPPIAAAAAYYKTADKHAPRFILLDEAFAGISSDNRESCMELIVEFGLDAVLTSENEWGMYAGVPQLAICQLDRFSDLGAVVNRVFIWNGKDRLTASLVEDSADNSLFTEQ